MATLSLDDRINQIEDILAGGVSSVSRAGRTVSYDLDQLRVELNRLYRQKRAQAGERAVRRVVYNPAFRR